MQTIDWRGVYPAMLTPFKEDDSIDFQLLKKNVEAQVKAGVNGLVLGGSLGEASTLEKPEIVELLVFVKSLVGDKVPVVINIAEQSTAAAVKLAQTAELNGADGLMILPPMRYKADDRETVVYLETVAKHTALPMMIYNNPHDYKIEVTLPMFEALGKLSNVQAIKESTRDVTNVTRLKNRFGDRFKILCGVDTQAFEELALGADGWVGGLVDAFPAETVAIYRLVKAGHYTEALQLFRWFLPLLELDIHPKLVQYIKLAATQTGIGSEYVRAPRLRIEGAEREAVLHIIHTAIAKRPELPEYLTL